MVHAHQFWLGSLRQAQTVESLPRTQRAECIAAAKPFVRVLAESGSSNQ